MVPIGQKAAPCSRLKEDHNDKADQKRGQHQAVKAKAELRYPIREEPSRIGPSPRDTEGPEQLVASLQVLPHRSPQGRSEKSYCRTWQGRRPKNHIETIWKPSISAWVYCGNISDLRRACSITPPAAKMVTKEFVAAEYRQQNRQQEVDHAQPGKEDIEKSKCEIYNRPDPKVIIPTLILLLHTFTLLSS